MALICTLVARLTEVEVKTIGHTVTTIEMKELVATLRDPRIRMKSRRPSTQGITEYQRRRSGQFVTHFLKKESYFSTH